MLNTPKAIQITTTSTQMRFMYLCVWREAKKKTVFANDKKYAWEFGIWYCWICIYIAYGGEFDRQNHQKWYITILAIPEMVSSFDECVEIA